MTEPTDRLAEIDLRLAELAAEKDRLVAERAALTAPPPATPFFPPPATPVYGAPAAKPAEVSPRSAQNTLLTLGALLLVGAVLVFAAVTYRQLGVVGRALVLFAVTAVTVPVARLLSRRGLGASAEAVTSIGLVLGVVDASAVRRAGWSDGISSADWSALSGGVLALLAAAWLWFEPRKATGIGTVVLAQAPVLFGTRADGLGLALLGAADVAVALFLTQPLPAVRRTAGTIGALMLLVATARCWSDVLHDRRAGVLGLVVAAASTGIVGWRRLGTEREAAYGLAAVLTTASLFGLVRPDVSHAHRPLLLVVAATLVLVATWGLPRTDRYGAAIGSLALVAVGVAMVGELVADGLRGPITWLHQPWTLTAASARGALLPSAAWAGDDTTWLVLLIAAMACALAALLVRQRDVLGPAALLLTVGALALLPVSLDLTYRAAVATQLSLAAAVVLVGLALRARLEGLALALAGLALGTIGTVWSVADEGTTLAALPVLAVVVALTALAWPGILTGLTTLLVAGEVAVLGAHADLVREDIGLLVLLVAAVAVGGSFAIGGLHRLGLEGGAAGVGLLSLVLTADDPTSLAWSLAALGVLALVVAVRADRRPVGLAGGLLLTFSSWVRLADAGVHAPEPYVVPLATVALVAGYLRRRSHPGMGSWEAYAAGLSLGLGPSLLKSFDDETPTRGLLLVVAAAAVVVAGVPQRLRAPLVVGSAVAVLDLLHLLAPYASALPRWLILAAVGAALIGAGATYEQRRKDMARLKETYDTWV